MIRKLILISVFAGLIAGCTSRSDKPESSAQEAGGKSAEVQVYKEYYDNGRLKTSVEALGKLRHGVTRTYRMDGTLETEIHYQQNRKHGPAIHYYNDGRTRKTEIFYEKGFKQGTANWYFPDGQLYRATPYEKGKIDGIRKVYYESGQVQAEIPYKAGQPGKGLKEYKQNGTLREYDARIIIREINRISMDNTFQLRLSLSNGSRSVDFYTGELTEGRFWNDELTRVPTRDGTGIMSFRIQKGDFRMETLNIVARDKTSLSHYQILSTTYHLAVENPY